MPSIILPPARPSRHALFIGAALFGAAACGDSAGTSAPRADLVTTLTGPAQGIVGDVLTYSLEVRNDGPDAAAQVIATVALTTGLSFDAATDGGTATGGTITWPVLRSLASGASQTLGLSVRVDAAGAASLAAAAISDTDDPTPGNNDGTAASSRVAVAGSAPPTTADLSATLAGTLSGANGDTVTATLTVMNAGPLAAQNVSVSLAIPDPVDATVTSAEPATRQTGKIVWDLGALALNETRQLTVDIVIPITSTNPLVASVTSTTPDAAPGNNNGAAANARALVRAVLVPLKTLVGEAVGDAFGWVTANLGDLTGDGVADFASTAPLNGAGGTQAGRGYVYSGASGTELYRVTGDVARGQLGFTVAEVGDIDGDGTADIAFGAPGINTALNGYVLLISGQGGGLIRRINGPSSGSGFGYAVGKFRDFDGDGVLDVLIGAPGRSPGGVTGAGEIHIVSGETGATLGVIAGTRPLGLLGVGVSGIGDVDNDGLDDIAAGASGEPGGGAIHIFSGVDGSDLVPAFSPPSGGSNIGQFWVNSPGDLDGDGTPDVFAVDFANGTGGALRGVAYVISGATGGLVRAFLGESPGDQYGIGRGIGDITGDGRTDFVLAAWQRSEGAPGAGKIYVVDGATGAALRTFISLTAGETLGYDAIGLGDVNGDGLPDYLVTGGQNINQGKAYIVAGVPLP